MTTINSNPALIHYGIHESQRLSEENDKKAKSKAQNIHANSQANDLPNADLMNYLEEAMAAAKNSDPATSVHAMAQVLNKIGIHVSKKHLEMAVAALPQLEKGVLPVDVGAQLPSPLDTEAAHLMASVASYHGGDLGSAEQINAGVQEFGSSLNSGLSDPSIVPDGTATINPFNNLYSTGDMKSNPLWFAVIIMLAVYKAMEGSAYTQSTVISAKTDVMNRCTDINNAALPLQNAMSIYIQDNSPTVTNANATVSGMLTWMYSTPSSSDKSDVQGEVISFLNKMNQGNWSGMPASTYSGGSATPSTYGTVLGDLLSKLTQNPSTPPTGLADSASEMSSLLNAAINHANTGLTAIGIDPSNDISGITTITGRQPDVSFNDILNNVLAQSSTAKNSITTNSSEDNTNLNQATTLAQTAMTMVQTILSTYIGTAKAAVNSIANG